MLATLVRAQPYEAPDTLWSLSLDTYCSLCEFPYILVQPDQSIVLAGDAIDASPGDLAVLHLDSAGHVDSCRRFGEPQIDEWCGGLCPAPHAGYAVAGYTRDVVYPPELSVRQFNAQGTLQNGQQTPLASGFYLYEIIPGWGGGYVAAGSLYGDSFNDYRGLVVRLDASGDTVWIRFYPTADSARVGEIRGICQTPDSGYALVTGSEADTATGYPLPLLILTDGQGNVISTRHYGALPGIGIFNQIFSVDGGYLLAGEYNPPGSARRAVYLVRTNLAGDTLWTRFLENSLTTGYGKCLVTADNRITLLTWDPYDQAVLSRLNAEGNILWQRLFTHMTSLWGHVLGVDRHGRYYFNAMDILGYNRFMCTEPDTTIAGIIGDDTPQSSDPFRFEDARGQLAIGAYPNPYNSATIIRYSIGSNAHVTLGIYDILGRHVVDLVNDRVSPGDHAVHFNAAALPSGLYWARLVSGGDTQVLKLLQLR